VVIEDDRAGELAYFIEAVLRARLFRARNGLLLLRPLKPPHRDKPRLLPPLQKRLSDRMVMDCRKACVPAR